MTTTTSTRTSTTTSTTPSPRTAAVGSASSPALTSSPVPTSNPGRATGRARWPLFGVVAGAAGLGGALASISSGVSEEDARLGVDVVDQLDRGNYYLAFLLGLVSVAALLLTVTGWRRWAEQRAPGDLAARTIASALGATAAVNILGTAFAGSMAIYLPGGADEGWLSKEAIFVNYTMLDFGMLLGWWGGMVAAGCVAASALRRGNLLPRWMGVVSIVLMLPAIVFAVATGLPGFPGLVMPIWLAVISIGMMVSRSARA